LEARRLEEQRAQQAEALALALALAQQPRAKRAIQKASSVAAKVLSAVFRRAIHPSYGSCQPPQLPAAAPQQPVSSLAALLAGDRQHEPLPKVEQDLHTFPRQDASKLAQKMAQEQQQEAAQVAADAGRARRRGGGAAGLGAPDQRRRPPGGGGRHARADGPAEGAWAAPAPWLAGIHHCSPSPCAARETAGPLAAICSRHDARPPCSCPLPHTQVALAALKGHGSCGILYKRTTQLDSDNMDTLERAIKSALQLPESSAGVIRAHALNVVLVSC
jgi:hypothetical protein